jgi:putative ABC transport system permease protein
MLSHYLAVALRNIRGAPFASVVSLLTLSVGLVCFVTAYAFVTFWGTAEQHFPKAKDIYVLALSMKNRDSKSGFAFLNNSTAVPDVAAEFLKSDYPAITKIARAVVIDRKTMIASGGRAERLFGVAVDPEFLDMFDLPFIAGDPHSALASPRSLVLTRDAAVRLFGSDNPIGKAVVIGNSVDATVTGVVDAIPEPSHLGHSANARLPFDLLASRDIYDSLGRGGPFGGGPIPESLAWTLIGTIVYLYLPPSGGLSADALSAKLGDFVERHVPAETLKNQSYSFSLEPVKDLLKGSGDFFGSGLSFSAALLLLGGLVLGVACVNYANLATARAARRVREIGVRKALGASPTQIAVQNLFEAGALTLTALAVALVAFVLVQPLIKGLLGAEVGPNFFSHLAAWPSLGAIVIAVALAAGAYPAFVLSRVRPMSAIATARGQLGSALFSTLLVGAQFAVASFLLIAVTVISMQNAEMRRTALKGLTDPLVVIDNPARQTKVSAATLRERLEALPQVRGVTELRSTPWEFLMMTNVAESADPTAPQRGLEVRQVGFDFFRVFDVPLLAGRVFDREHAEDLPRAGPPGPLGAAPGPAPAAPPKPSAAADASNPPPPTNIIVEASVVATLNLGTPEQAIDKLIYRPAPPIPGAKPQPPMRIIGVVENRAFSFFKTPLKTFGAMYSLQPDLDVTVARVAATDIAGGLKGIDAVWKQLAPNVAISRRFLDDIFEEAYAYNVRINELFGFLAVTAFAICVAGLFGMATFVASRRRREIGVRKTLGGSTRQMVALLLAGFTRPVLIANLIAWPAGYLAARRYLNQFPQSIDLTLWPFLMSVAITVAIAWLAVVGQTVRAARTAPGEVLRHE